MSMLRELSQAWHESNTKQRIGLVLGGLGVSAMIAAGVADLADHVEINGYQISIGDETLLLMEGGGLASFVVGGVVFRSGLNEQGNTETLDNQL